MKFTKMQALGNDYICINTMEEKIENPIELTKKLSNRHLGVGGDGVIFIDASEKADVKMRMYNADGTEGKLCGNGVRCVAKYVYERKIVRNEKIRIETYNRIIKTKIFLKKDENGVIADMGKVSVGQKNKKISVGKTEYSSDYISIENPHLVVYVDDLEKVDMREWEEYGLVNVEFISVVNRGMINMRVKERGVGETMACGTGACVAAVSCMMRNYVDNYVEVKMPGGNLTIEWEKEKNHVWMTGEAKTVFEGEIDVCLL